MNNIQAYTNQASNYKVNKNFEANRVNNLLNNTEEKKASKSSDRIEISQTNDIIINTKKAYDAFRDSCKEIGETTWDGYVSGDMSLDFFTICDYMKLQGINVPNFTCEGDIKDLMNNNDFIGFIDKMEEFVKTRPEFKNNIPDKLFDFTKLFKEKLIQYGCK